MKLTMAEVLDRLSSEFGGYRKTWSFGTKDTTIYEFCEAVIALREDRGKLRVVETNNPRAYAFIGILNEES